RAGASGSRTAARFGRCKCLEIRGKCLRGEPLMATLFISEHNAGASAGLPLVRWPALQTQTIAIGGSSQQSNPFGLNTKIIRVHTDAVCSIDVGPNPTATTSL